MVARLAARTVVIYTNVKMRENMLHKKQFTKKLTTSETRKCLRRKARGAPRRSISKIEARYTMYFVSYCGELRQGPKKITYLLT